METTHTEHQVLHSKGEIKWVEISSTHIIFKGRKILQGTFHDISERKLMEAVLSINERKFRTYIDSSPIGIFVVDEYGHYLDCNKAACNLLGFTKEALLCKSIPDLLPKEEINIGILLFTELKAKGTVSQEVKILHKSGSIIPVILDAVRLPDKRYMAFCTDITQRKKFEDELLETNFQLELETARANSLAAQAEAANSAKSLFLANMTHEIRTPLNGVLGGIDLLSDTELTHDQRTYANIVKSSGECLLSIISDILDLSKIEAHRLQLEQTDFNIRQEIENTAEMLSLQAQKKDLELIIHIDPKLPILVSGDPIRLRQIIINLGGNAIKFTDKGEVIISAKLKEENECNLVVEFTFTDTGIGISQERMDLLFTAFQQLDPSITRRFGGTGLGLTISKHLVELMGGKIGVESVKNKGSTFWFTATFIKTKQDNSNPNHLQLNQKEILLITENSEIYKVILDLTSHWGLETHWKKSVQHSFEYIDSKTSPPKKFDYVLIDQRLLTNESVLSQIKEKFNPDNNLILLSSFYNQKDFNYYKNYGFKQNLLKPIRQSSLYDCLQTLSFIKNESSNSATLQNTSEKSFANQSDFSILVAEDSVVNQVIALKTLEKMGFKAEVAQNGKDAIKALENKQYDLVLMDVQMPDMDGIEATRLIRTGQTGISNFKIPILAMTANATKDDLDRCIKVGMNDTICKPFDYQTMVQKIDKWLTKKV